MEPSADIRNAAAKAWEIYSAYLATGFTADQALTLLVNMIQAAGKQV